MANIFLKPERSSQLSSSSSQLSGLCVVKSYIISSGTSFLFSRVYVFLKVILLVRFIPAQYFESTRRYQFTKNGDQCKFMVTNIGGECTDQLLVFIYFVASPGGNSDVYTLIMQDTFHHAHALLAGTPKAACTTLGRKVNM